MKQHVYILMSFSLLFILFSCNKTIRNNAEFEAQVKNIIVDLNRNPQLPYDSLISKAVFIKLETNKQNTIGQISQILFVDSLIVVVDSESAQSINIFDLEGRWKCKVGSIGSGPEEFIEISNVVIVPERKWICILDRPQKKILYFDLAGQFISYERQSFMLNYFEYIDTDHKAFNVIGMYDYAYGKNRGNALIVTNSTNNILYGEFNDTYQIDFDFVINRPLRKFADKVFFTPNMTDSIFIVERDKIVPKYYIDIKTNGMPRLSNKTLTNKKLDDYMKRFFFFNGDFIELKDFTFLNIATPWSYPFAIYSHEKQDVYLTSGEFTNPLFAFCQFAPMARYQENGIVYPVDPYMLYNSKDEFYKMKAFKTLLDELYEGLDLNSNPVLFIYHLNTNLGK